MLTQVHTRSAENKIAGVSSTAALPLQKLCQQPFDRAAAQRIPFIWIDHRKIVLAQCAVQSQTVQFFTEIQNRLSCFIHKNSAFPGKRDVSNSFMCRLHINSIFITSIGKTLYNAASSIETVVFLRILPTLIFMLSSSQAKSSDIFRPNMLY